MTTGTGEVEVTQVPNLVSASGKVKLPDGGADWLTLLYHCAGSKTA
ncbi:hypothetical protein PH562_17545 [Rhizobium sp. CNPSo 4062]|nr:hypothetical protein [Rhizobium sp. CNPSo 4062]MDK4704059.1 hypothetical protein [Rhizobium sp. CNPSo 4062]